MANSKIPVATTIPLAPLGDESFYAVIIPEKLPNLPLYYHLWIFRANCGVALHGRGAQADQAPPDMTPDGVRTLDAIGQFDYLKEELCEMQS